MVESKIHNPLKLQELIHNTVIALHLIGYRLDEDITFTGPDGAEKIYVGKLWAAEGNELGEGLSKQWVEQFGPVVDLHSDTCNYVNT